MYVVKVVVFWPTPGGFVHVIRHEVDVAGTTAIVQHALTCHFYFYAHLGHRLVLSWLDRREIGPNHQGFWVLFCHLHCPDTRARSNIQDPPRNCERCKMQVMAAEQHHDMVFNVKPFELLLWYLPVLFSISDPEVRHEYFAST